MAQTKYPSSASGTFTNPSNATGTEDNICAYANVHYTYLDVYNFGFSLVNPPTEVLVNAKAIVVDSTLVEQMCEVFAWNGVDWIFFKAIGPEWRAFPQLKCSDSYWRGEFDITYLLNTAAKVNNAKLRFRHWYVAGGGPGVHEPWTTYIDACYLKVTEGTAEKTQKSLFLQLLSPSTIDWVYVQRMQYLAWKATKHLG